MKCSTKYCRKTKEKGKNFCSRCIKRKYRAAHPFKAAFQNLKSNAKRRGKEFELTFEEFKSFAIGSGYMAGKGRTIGSLHIDRIDPSRGYVLDNIRALDISENVSRHHDYMKEFSENNDDLPF